MKEKDKITVRIEEKLYDEDLKKLMEFMIPLSDSFTLSRYYDEELPEEIRRQVDAEYEEILREDDRDRRRRFEEDEDYRKDMLEMFGDEESVCHYFDEWLEQDLKEDEEDLTDIIDEDEEDFEEFDILDLFEEGELSEEDILILPEEELVPEEDMEEIDYGELREGPYETERGDYLESWYTRLSYVTLNPLFELSRFSMGETLQEALSQMKHLFSYPVILDETWFEDLAFHKGAEVKMAVCSHESFCHLDLTKEEYDQFKKLNLPHVVEG